MFYQCLKLVFTAKFPPKKNYDFLKFYIDGVEQAAWSGEVPWSKVVFPVQSGSHIFAWTYSKDYSVLAGSDKAWVDFIVWPPEQSHLLIANAGLDDLLCAPSVYQLNPKLLNAESCFWTTNGDGYFENPNNPNALYHAGTSDITFGSVVLTVHAVRSGVNTIADALVLTIYKSAVAQCGNDVSVCQHNAYLVNQSTASDYTSLNWTSSGDGVFDNQSILHPNYILGANDIINGSVKLILTANGCVQCPPSVDSMILVIHPYIHANAGTDQTINFGTYAQLQGTASGSSNFLFHWEPGNMVLMPQSATTYTIDLEETTTFILKATDANTGCYTQDTNVVLVIGAPMSAIANALPSSVCKGQTTQLNVIASGGSGNYTYNWTSNPAGFVSSIANPVVQPLLTTQYFVIVYDGIISVESSIEVIVDTVVPVAPTQPIGPTFVNTLLYSSTEYISQGNSSSLAFNWLIVPSEAGSLIQSGSNCTVFWSPIFSGNAQLSVSSVNGCGSSIFSQPLSIYASPTIDLKESAGNQVVEIWPNPTSTSISIRILLSNDAEYKIVNNLGSICGRGVFKANEETYRLHISEFASGVYTIIINAGKEIYYGKLVKM